MFDAAVLAAMFIKLLFWVIHTIIQVYRKIFYPAVPRSLHFYHQQTMMEVGLGYCKTEGTHAICSSTFVTSCTDGKPFSPLKTILYCKILSMHLFSCTSNQMVSSKSSKHEMTSPNPLLQNFHFAQPDRFSA